MYCGHQTMSNYRTHSYSQKHISSNIKQSKDICSVDDDWHITGNAGTDPTRNFVGTVLSNQDIAISAGGLSGPHIVVSTLGQIIPTFPEVRGIPDILIGAGAGGNESIYKIYNVAIGDNSLGNNAFGNANISIGKNSCFTNLSGSQNVCIGVNSHQSSKIISGDVAIGYNSLY